MIALMVTIQIKPGHKDAFMSSMFDDARGSNNDEPGCIRFDVLQDSEDDNRIICTRCTRTRRPWTRTGQRRTIPSGAKPWVNGLTGR